MAACTALTVPVTTWEKRTTKSRPPLGVPDVTNFTSFGSTSETFRIPPVAVFDVFAPASLPVVEAELRCSGASVSSSDAV